MLKLVPFIIWLNIVSINLTGLSQTVDEGLIDLTNQITSGMSESKKHKIAVVEFSDLEGRVTEFGKFLSEELITRLFISKKFNVVERQLLNKILEEHQLNVTGLVDESTAKQLGRILGVDAICSGTVTEFTDHVRINARLISTESGEIFSVAATKIVMNESIKALMKKYTTTSQEPSSSQKAEDEAKFEFNDKIFNTTGTLGRNDPPYVIKLVSVQFLTDLKLKASYTIENKGRKTGRITFFSPKNFTYALDPNGNKYGFVQLIDAPRDLLPELPIRFSIIFEPIPETVTRIATVFKISTGAYTVDVVFNDIELR